MKPSKHLLWALGINGEGSARVTFSFIRHILSTPHHGNTTTIVYSSHSTLDRLISSHIVDMGPNYCSSNINLIRLPKISRNYLLHFLIKIIFVPSILYTHIVVFDDYPFRFSRYQVLYLHQPNLIYNASIVWAFKRLAFRFLLSSQLTIYLQTQHMRNAFASRFGTFNFMCFTHDLS